ncbi:hypothetical protein E2C01_050034 [Portunus trituberculatus]|uniref:Uncharacterized protein n=1 Tax=Portunus trituberculatus TaxID=210409 RepID=A0A5B7GFF9_PORTR|nr:hypothetical protein [Portunus trituberculatus]
MASIMTTTLLGTYQPFTLCHHSFQGHQIPKSPLSLFHIPQSAQQQGNRMLEVLPPGVFAPEV